MELNKSILFPLVLSSFLFAYSINASRISFSPAPSPSSFETTFDQRTLNLPQLPPIIDPKIEEICSTSTNPKNCVSFIAPYLKGSINAESTEKTVIDTLKLYVEEASKIAMQVRSESTASLEIKSSTDESVELYQKAIASLDSASAACTSRDIRQVQVMLGSAVSNLGYCNDAFEKKGLKIWPLKETNDLLIEFVGYGIDISAHLRKSISMQKDSKNIS